MKRIVIAIIVIIVAVLVILPHLHPPGHYVAGHIRVPARGISAEVYTQEHGPDCGCTSTLWHGGIASTKADLSGVQVDDTATLTMLDGSRLVLECVEIIPCIRLGRWLIGWQGILQPQGDVLLVYMDGLCVRALWMAVL